MKGIYGIAGNIENKSKYSVIRNMSFLPPEDAAERGV